MVVTSQPSAWTASTVAGLHAPAVEVDGAGAAVAGVAADDRAGLAERCAQVVDEQHPGFDVVGVGHSVDGDVDAGHAASTSWDATTQQATASPWLPATSLWLDALSSNAVRPRNTRVSAEPWTGQRQQGTHAPRSGTPQRETPWWIGPSSVGQPPAPAAPPQRDDLGGDDDGGLLRGARAEVEADRARRAGPARPRSARPRAAAPAGPRGCAATPSRRRRRRRAAAAPPRAAARRTSGRG